MFREKGEVFLTDSLSPLVSGSSDIEDDEFYEGEIDTNGKCWHQGYNNGESYKLSVMANLKLEAVLDKDQGLNSTQDTP